MGMIWWVQHVSFVILWNLEEQDRNWRIYPQNYEVKTGSGLTVVNERDFRNTYTERNKPVKIRKKEKKKDW